MIAWTDIETDGLREQGGHILEVAFVITDDDLNEVAAESVIVLPVGELVDDVVKRMHPVVREMHTNNGLIDEVKARGLYRYQAELILVSFVETHFAGVPAVALDKCEVCGCGKADHVIVDATTPVKAWAKSGPHVWLQKHEPALKHTPVGGSTVAFDRRWLREHMGTLEGLFLHRSIDVSSLNELARRWRPDLYEARPERDAKHRALDDVRESIECLRYYRRCGFISSQSALADAA